MYNYQEQKKNLFTQDGVSLVIKIKEKSNALIKQSGCVSAAKLIYEATSTWDGLAAIDYLCEEKFLKEVPQENIVAQDRIFILNN